MGCGVASNDILYNQNCSICTSDCVHQSNLCKSENRPNGEHQLAHFLATCVALCASSYIDRTTASVVLKLKDGEKKWQWLVKFFDM